MATTYVTDTHALLWYLQGSSRLSTAARQSFDDVVTGASDLVIPVIVIAELALLLEKGRAAIDLNAILETLHDLPTVSFAPLSLEVTLSVRVSRPRYPTSTIDSSLPKLVPVKPCS